MKGEIHRGGTHPVGLWTLAPEKLWCWRNLEKGGVGLCWTLTWIVSGLVEKVGLCGTLVKNCGQLLCKELSSSGWHIYSEWQR